MTNAERCREEFIKTGMWPNEVMYQNWRKAWEAGAKAERERAELDAKRYQWLVENANINTATWAHYGLDPASTKHPLDNAIDAAIREKT